MKRLFIHLATLLFWLSPTIANNSEGRLKGLTAAISALGSYEVEFEMVVNGEALDFDGYYIVDGERYQLSMPRQSIIGDSTIRYTIDSTNREVVVEGISDGAPLLISNPARAFLVLDQSFDAVLKYTGEDYYTISLRPKRRDPILKVAQIDISHETNLPLSVIYTSQEGEEIAIKLYNIRSHRGGVIPTTLDETLYPDGYEVIDFR